MPPDLNREKLSIPAFTADSLVMTLENCLTKPEKIFCSSKHYMMRLQDLRPAASTSKKPGKLMRFRFGGIKKWKKEMWSAIQTSITGRTAKFYTTSGKTPGRV